MKKMFLKIAVIAVNKVTGPRSFFIKKETLAQVFSCEFWEISKITFSCWTHLVAASVSTILNAYLFDWVYLFINNLFLKKSIEYKYFIPRRRN